MSVLSRAELLLQAKNYSGSGDWLDESGNGHDAQLGSTSGADTNDPLFLRYAGSKYLYLPGSSGNYASTPDAASLDITSSFEAGVRVALTDLTPAAGQYLIGHGLGGAAGWFFQMLTTGTLRLTLNSTSWGSTASLTTVASDGDLLWLKVEFEVNSEVRFYYSTDATNDYDAVSWTQLGAAVDASAQGTFTAGSVAFTMGSSHANSLPLTGRLYRGIAVDGLGGTPVFDVDFNAATEPFASFTENTGKTVTINRASSGRVSTVVDRDLFLLGTDDYFQIADHDGLDFAADEDLTVMLVGRSYDVSPPTSDRVLVAKKDDLTTAAGYALYLESSDNTAKFVIADGTADDEDASPNLTAGERFVVAGVRNVTDDDIEAFLDGTGSGSPTTDSTTSTLANALPLRLGATSGTAANFFDGEIHAVALWREALTDAEIREAESELLGEQAVWYEPLMMGVG